MKVIETSYAGCRFRSRLGVGAELLGACQAARSARFEHGESGAPKKGAA
ncbi:MAG: hypothetical protein ACRDMV_05725 [Streptosporangiales bacterium]